MSLNSDEDEKKLNCRILSLEIDPNLINLG